MPYMDPMGLQTQTPSLVFLQFFLDVLWRQDQLDDFFANKNTDGNNKKIILVRLETIYTPEN